MSVKEIECIFNSIELALQENNLEKADDLFDKFNTYIHQVEVLQNLDILEYALSKNLNILTMLKSYKQDTKKQVNQLQNKAKNILKYYI